uniref:Uncharacterized protein n=1 Tax=Magnetococcus massalia (strain MO-1) TaxID=451514 RepID=A0A1S7LL97_MAGMO|nr:Protein of unknown function [Candidatus Magnetococcus massalia]
MEILNDPQTATWVIAIISLIAILVGGLKIIGNGITLLLWLLLVVAGVAGLDYAFKGEGGKAITAELPQSVQQALSEGEHLSQQALRSMCQKLDQQR